MNNNFSRKATLDDFINDDDINNETNETNETNKTKNNYQKNYQKDNDIQKNQKEYGHKKRIKP